MPGLATRDKNDKSGWLYRFAQVVCYWTYRVIWRLEVRNIHKIPRTGAVIFAPNHKSYADPPLVGCTVTRTIHFMAKKQLFRFKPFGWLITNLNAHPLNRAGASGAIKEAQRLLGEGKTIIIFPEGRRIQSDPLGPAKAGVGLLALKTEAPVVPIYIHNSNHMTRLKKIIIVIGDPVSPKGFGDYQKFADHLLQKIQDMKDKFQK